MNPAEVFEELLKAESLEYTKNTEQPEATLFGIDGLAIIFVSGGPHAGTVLAYHSMFDSSVQNEMFMPDQAAEILTWVKTNKDSNCPE